MRCLAHRDANILNASSTMSHFSSSLRIWPRARAFNAGTSYCGEVCQMAYILTVIRRPGTDLVRKSVNGLWGWSGDAVPRGCDDFCATRSAIPFGSGWCEFYHIRVEIHQKSLEPIIVSTKCRRGPSLHSRHECHVRDFHDLPFFNMFLVFFT